MKSIKTHTQHCMICGSKIVKTIPNDETVTCERCGEEYDLELLSKMELEFDEFDKLLLLDLKTRKRKTNQIAHLIH